MNRAHPRLGYPGPLGDRSRLFYASQPFRREARGFTLLEMVMVLLIIALLLGLSMPAMQSAFTEQAVRRDAHQLAIMVKTAMIQSAEQHRIYVIDLNDGSMALHPLGQAAAPVSDAANTASFDDTAAPNNSAPVDVDVTSDLDVANKLQAPDPLKANSWVSMPDGTQWTFQPGELCMASHVRVARGDTWVEMSFNALTGDVENESYNLP
jgi:prepilin-type N-terminal cleavage/methylation domain-containing protein